MKYNNINEESIDKLMDIFYDMIREDRDLSPIFNDKIGTDEHSWNLHKDKIARFWKKRLLDVGEYKGIPIKAHIDLAPFPKEMFDIWLGLFDKSLASLYVNEVRCHILYRANEIANVFKKVLYEEKV